jgi:hypothetical protein
MSIVGVSGAVGLMLDEMGWIVCSLGLAGAAAAETHLTFWGQRETIGQHRLHQQQQQQQQHHHPTLCR